MKRLVINGTNGAQHILLIERSGGSTDPSKVIWNEWVDGPIGEQFLSNIGGLVRGGTQQAPTLSVDAGLLAAYQSAQAAAATAKTQKEQRIAQAKQALNQAALANGDPDLTAQQIRQLFRFIRVILKDVANQLD